MFITLSGTPGSGKSSAGRLLAQRLNIPFFGMGSLRRNYAAEQGLSLQELNQREESALYSDIVVDQYQAKLPEQYSDFVLDGSVSYYFVPQAFKIYLTVDIREGAERILQQHRDVEHWNTIEEGIASLKERERSNMVRFTKLYNTDPRDLKHYDLVLDTSGKTPENIVAEIIAELQKRHLLKDEKHL